MALLGCPCSNVPQNKMTDITPTNAKHIDNKLDYIVATLLIITNKKVLKYKLQISLWCIFFQVSIYLLVVEQSLVVTAGK